MIPRYLRVIYWVLVGGCVLMLILLVRGCERNRERVLAMRDQSPIAAPTDVPNEQVSVALVNDADGSVTLDSISLAMPAEPPLKAKVVLDRMLTNLSLANSTHPVPAGPNVTDVFFVSLPMTGNSNPATQPYSDPVTASEYGRYHAAGAELAVVNLSKAFADAHTSGIEAEDLTLRAILATLHANFPEIEQVRFTVDGALRETLAGHADLSRSYGVAEPAKAIHVLSGDGTPP